MGADALSIAHEHEGVLTCPNCSGTICGLCGQCAGCGEQTPLDEGILRVLKREHPFYEGAYQAQIHFPEQAINTLKGRVLLPFISYGYLKALIEHVPRGARVLELGCGGGMRLAATRYRVTAVDLSLASLKGTPDGYRHRIQADVRTTDFPKSSYDAIAASCFWEHFTPAEKDILLEKFAAWLKPEGALILFFDTASENPGFRWFRRFPDLYQKCFVDHDGHVGLETVSDNRARFAKRGWRLVRGTGLNRTLQHLPVYTWMAPFAERSPFVKATSQIGRWLSTQPLLSLVFTASVHAWDLTIGRVFPSNWSRLFLGVWRRDLG